MFILDSLFMSSFRWVLDTVVTAADAEMNDDTALREQLLDAEMRREMGEISDDEFAELERDVLARIREIKERREGGSGPLALSGNQPMEATPGSQFQIEATVSGDFHEPQPAGDLDAKPLHADEDSGTIIEGTLVEPVGEGGAMAESNPSDARRAAGRAVRAARARAKAPAAVASARPTPRKARTPAAARAAHSGGARTTAPGRSRRRIPKA